MSDTLSFLPDFDSLVEPAPKNRIQALIVRYSVDKSTLQRKYPLKLSPLCTERMKRFLDDWTSLLDGDRIEFESLRHDERIDFVLFRNHLAEERRGIDLRAAKEAEMAALLPFAPAIIALEEARITFDWAEPEAAAGLLDAIATQIEAASEAIRGIEQGIRDFAAVKTTVANRAAESAAYLQKTLKGWYDFYFGFQPMFTWWAEAPYKAVDAQLAAYAELIRKALIKAPAATAGKDTGEDIIGDPIGREALLEYLRLEMIAYSPEELIEIAEKELAYCEGELRAASRELGFGDDTAAALEHVKRLHPLPGGQADYVKSLALEAVDYLDKHDLVTIPDLAREVWRLCMMSPEMQLVNPFFLGGEMIYVSYPTHTMSHNQKLMSMRGNNAHFSRATVQHELIPGHHLQFFQLGRHHTYREPFQTPFWIEGWTIYWELLLYSRGFAAKPEDRIGMMFWRIHRCVRIIFSLGFHLEKLTPAECIELLVNRVGHERANAIAEVRRSCGDAYPPLYQAAYLIGGLQMWALRREFVLTGKIAERDFHDAVVRGGCIPMEMVRANLTQSEIDRNFESSWRFYADPEIAYPSGDKAKS